MRKWITKTEITKILNTYSIKKDEFEPIEKLEYCYQSKYVKGYMITISKEINHTEETGRILVSHTKSSGKRTYNDIWEWDKDGNLQFCFRNLWNQPFSDAAYIKDLEEENRELKEAGRKLQEQLNSQKQPISENVSEKPDTEYQKLKDENTRLYHLLKESNQEKKQLLEEIQNMKESQKINNETKHNARGAGRKRLGESPKTIEKLKQVKELLDRGFGESEIIEKLGISRATFYRYKKNLKINL